MVIYRNSRYATAKITAVKEPDGTIKKFVHSRRVFSSENLGDSSSLYTVDGVIELDHISHKYYKDEAKYWFIADCNEILFPLHDPALIGDNQIHIGSTIYIPSRTEMIESLQNG